MCVSGGKKCSFFGKFGGLCFLETPVLRLAFLPYFRRKGSSLWKLDFHSSDVNFLKVWKVTKNLEQIFKSTKNYLLQIELASNYRNASRNSSCLACCSLTQSTTSSMKKNFLYAKKCCSTWIFVLKNISKDNRFEWVFNLLPPRNAWFLQWFKRVSSLF